MSGKVKRREFITLLGGAAAWPISAQAQQPDRLRRIGILLMVNAEATSLRTELRESLGKSGYVEGQNLKFEVRSADGNLDLLPRLAAELVATKVDVIVAQFTPSALAAKRATTEIPDSIFCRRSGRNGHCTEPCATWRKFHWPLHNGRRIANQKRGTAARYASVRAPYSRSWLC